MTGEEINQAFISHISFETLQTSLSVYTIESVLLIFLFFTTSIFYLFYFRKKAGKPAKSRHEKIAVSVFLFLMLIVPGGLITHSYALMLDLNIDKADSQEAISNLNQTFQFGSYTYKDDLRINSIPDTPKNLVLIYLESVESGYLNKDLFPGITPNLNRLSKESEFYPNFYQAPGTGWTIAGIHSSQCGLPLMYGLGGNSSLTQITDSKMSCLGDILKKAGYYQTYIGGADHSFAGKGTFLKQHGYDEVVGKHELFSNDPTLNLHWWGVRDIDTIEYAKKKYLSLSKSEKPFNLTLLTLDTHHPNGLPDPRCKDFILNKKGIDLVDSVECTDHIIGEFVEFINSLPNADQTLIVILPDHLAMRTTTSEKLKEEKRKLFAMFLNSKSPGIKDSELLHFDIADMILNRLNIASNATFPLKNLSNQPFEERISHIKNNQRSITTVNISLSNQFQFCESTITFQADENGVSLQSDSAIYPVTFKSGLKTYTTESTEIVSFDLDENMHIEKSSIFNKKSSSLEFEKARFLFGPSKQLFNKEGYFYSLIYQGKEITSFADSLDKLNISGDCAFEHRDTASSVALRLNKLNLDGMKNDLSKLKIRVNDLEQGVIDAGGILIFSSSYESINAGLKSGWVDINGPKLAHNLGLNIITEDDSGFKNLNFNTRASIDDLSSFINHVQNNEIIAIYASDSASKQIRKSKKHRDLLKSIGLANLSKLEFRQPYIAYRGLDGEFVERTGSRGDRIVLPYFN